MCTLPLFALLCQMAEPTPFFPPPEISSFWGISTGTQNHPSGLKRYFRSTWGGSIRLGHLFWPPPSQWPWHTHPSPSLLPWHFLYSLLSRPFLFLGSASGPGFWPPNNSSICPSLSGLSPQRASSLTSILRKLAGMTLPPTLTLTVLPQRITHLFLFLLLLLSLLLWHWMRPNRPFLSAATNAILKPGGLLRWKTRLVKDTRLSLLLTEVMKIDRLTSPLLDAPRQSSPRPRLRHGRRLALLFQPNLTLYLYTLFFAVSLALFPPLLTSPTVLLPGNPLRSMPLTWDPTFLFLSQRLHVAEPEATFLSSAEPRALRSPTRTSAFPSLTLNFLRLPPTFPPLLPLAQTKLPNPC